MVAEAKDQTAGPSRDTCVPVMSQPESKALSPNKKGFAPKVRKPYTITKQRERWTDEEHLRFIEALKLYGRAWRQIEEHVGTKTAIQIRSHAQKFFAKVTRDSFIDAHPIEIPPPRPKKKPLHPYPRKIVDLSNVEAFSLQEVEKPIDVCVIERDNGSPTSVLSAIGSDINLESIRLSPAFCATYENDNENATSNVTPKEEDGFHFSLKISSASTLEDNSTTRRELFPQEMETYNDSLCAGKPHTSIKLFGKTVVVRDTPKQSLEVVQNSIDNKFENEDVNLVHGLSSNNSDSQIVFGFVSSSDTQQHSLTNVYCHMENILSSPWCTWYPAPAYQNPSEGSSVGSKNGSTEVSPGTRNDGCESKVMSNLGKKEYGKGFVPYKRCLAERDDNSSFLQEEEGQRARVCS